MPYQSIQDNPSQFLVFTIEERTVQLLNNIEESLNNEFLQEKE